MYVPRCRLRANITVQPHICHMCVPFGTIAVSDLHNCISVPLRILHLPAGAFVSHTKQMHAGQADARRRLLIKWRRILLPKLLFYSLRSHCQRYVCTVKSSRMTFAYYMQVANIQRPSIQVKSNQIATRWFVDGHVEVDKSYNNFTILNLTTIRLIICERICTAVCTKI